MILWHRTHSSLNTQQSAKLRDAINRTNSKYALGNMVKITTGFMPIYHNCWSRDTFTFPIRGCPAYTLHSTLSTLHACFHIPSCLHSIAIPIHIFFYISINLMFRVWYSQPKLHLLQHFLILLWSKRNRNYWLVRNVCKGYLRIARLVFGRGRAQNEKKHLPKI